MDALTRLMKVRGQRFTSQKKDVFCALQQIPQTVLEILHAVKTINEGINKTTVYRILTSFVEMGIVKEIHLDTKEARYELADSGHHHHLVCERCGSIEDVSLNERELLKEVNKQSHFEIKRHSLEFFGTCKKCQ